MTFAKIEIVPELTGEETRRKKIKEFALKRRRRKDGTFAKAPFPKSFYWKPDEEFYAMVVKAFTDKGFPRSKLWFRKKKKAIVINYKCRGARRLVLILRRFYTPEYIHTFLKTYMQWDPSMRNKGGRPRKHPKKTS